MAVTYEKLAATSFCVACSKICLGIDLIYRKIAYIKAFKW